MLGTARTVDPETLQAMQKAQGGLCAWLWQCQALRPGPLRHQITWIRQVSLPTSVGSFVKSMLC